MSAWGVERRIVAVVALLAGFLCVGTVPASAHAGGLTSGNVRSEVVAVDPPVPGLDIETVEGGARLRLVNRTTDAVVVNGGARRVLPGETAVWRDSSATSLGRTNQLRAPREWTSRLVVGTRPVAVRGRLTWQRPGSAAPWWALFAGLTAATVLILRRQRRPAVGLAAAAVLAGVAGAGHVVGASLAVQDRNLMWTLAEASGVGLLAWPLIAVGVVGVRLGESLGVLAATAGAVLTAFVVLPDVPSFGHAVLPFAGPGDLDRLLIAAALATAAGVAVTSGRVLRSSAAGNSGFAGPADAGDDSRSSVD
ncbi:MAG: hypothetical protein ACRCYQ_09865 [Nocardioides sp.]